MKETGKNHRLEQIKEQEKQMELVDRKNASRAESEDNSAGWKQNQLAGNVMQHTPIQKGKSRNTLVTSPTASTGLSTLQVSTNNNRMVHL
jgi:hypothetical protein